MLPAVLFDFMGNKVRWEHETHKDNNFNNDTPRISYITAFILIMTALHTECVVAFHLIINTIPINEFTRMFDSNESTDLTQTISDSLADLGWLYANTVVKLFQSNTSYLH